MPILSDCHGATTSGGGFVNCLFADARREFLALRKDGGEDFAKWSAIEHEASQQVTHIKSVLNDYETIANDIESGILDERFYFSQIRGATLADYRAAKSFIVSWRNRQNPQYWVGFERLAERWEAIQPGKFPGVRLRERLFDTRPMIRS